MSEKIAPGNLLLYNTTQIALHVTNTVLLYHLFRIVFRDRTLAATSAFLFLVTYNHLGAVIWISGRTTLIMATFLLSSLLAAVGPVTRIRRFTAWGLFGLALLSVFLVGLTVTLVDGPVLAVLQTTVAPEVQGRVFTVIGSLTAVTSPLGLVIAGPVTDLIGLTTWYVIAGAACIVLGLLLFFVPDVVYIEERAKERNPATLESYPV